MLMPASSEFVALCEKQVALLTQTLGAALSVVYLTEELTPDFQAKLIPIVAYPELKEVWEENERLSLLPNQIQRVNNIPRLLLAAPQDGSMLPEVDDDGDPDSQQEKEENFLLRQRQIVLPLIHDGVVMGLLVTSREDRAWNQQERAQVESIANTMAIACILDQRSQWLTQQFGHQQRLQSQQNDILHNLLHQLRNPLTALRTFGKLLLKQLGLGDANRDIAGNILRESDRIQELLQQFDEVIDLSASSREALTLSPSQMKVERETDFESGIESPLGNKPRLLLPEAGLMRVASLEPCAVATVLEPLLVSAKAIAQDRNLRLIAEIPDNLGLVLANERGLREVFSNLIDNALKYTPAGGKVYVQAGLEQRSPQGCWQGIAVSDSGPGIPPADLERLFERHYRGVQAKTDIPGTGLGLTIARDLVRQMQGEIQVFSPAKYPENVISALDLELEKNHSGGVGATFIVWLQEVNN